MTCCWLTKSVLLIAVFYSCLGSPITAESRRFRDPFEDVTREPRFAAESRRFDDPFDEVTREPGFGFLDENFGEELNMFPSATDFPIIDSTEESKSDAMALTKTERPSRIPWDETMANETDMGREPEPEESFPDSFDWMKERDSNARRMSKQEADQNRWSEDFRSESKLPDRSKWPEAHEPAFESPRRKQDKQIEIPANETLKSESDEVLKQAINTVALHARQFITGIETVNDKTFKSMTELLKYSSGEKRMLGEFAAMLESWKLMCSGSEEVTEQFLHKMSVISTTHRSSTISERVLAEVRHYVQLYTNSIIKRHNAVMDMAFSLLNKKQLSQTEMDVLRQLVDHDNLIQKQSIRTVNNYMDLLNRLAKPNA